MQPLPKPAKQVQLRRGTSAQHLGLGGIAAFIGAEAELTFDTDLLTARVHDGATVGGYVLLRRERDGSINLGAFNISANGQTLTMVGGESNVRWQNGQMQFYDPAGPGWRAFGCDNGLPVFGTLLPS